MEIQTGDRPDRGLPALQIRIGKPARGAGLKGRPSKAQGYALGSGTANDPAP